MAGLLSYLELCRNDTTDPPFVELLARAGSSLVGDPPATSWTCPSIITIDELPIRESLAGMATAPNAPPTRRAALYVRVSTSDRGQTVENQLPPLQEAAGRLGWTLVGVFRDEGISGAKGRQKRPGLDALLKGVARREFDIVAAWSVCRLGRSLSDLIGLLGELRVPRHRSLPAPAGARHFARHPAGRCSGCWACSASSSGR